VFLLPRHRMRGCAAMRSSAIGHRPCFTLGNAASVPAAMRSLRTRAETSNSYKKDCPFILKGLSLYIEGYIWRRGWDCLRCASAKPVWLALLA
jgi:hypothetical protein